MATTSRTCEAARCTGDRGRAFGPACARFAALAWLALAQAAGAEAPDGLLFHVSANAGFVAEKAGGDPVPNFQHAVEIVPDGQAGAAIQCADDGYVTWRAPGNMFAQRGTLSFHWRPREPVGEAPFVIFRVGFADHSSWDMAFLRIDWNGDGFDAFVTDANLARSRVSYALKEPPAPDRWLHLAFAWDETFGVRLYVNGVAVARQDGEADLDSGLDQFGMAGRVISPHQVQSRYNFMRGSDLDELRVYDRMLSAPDIARLARGEEPGAAEAAASGATSRAWLRRFGWDGALPPLLGPGTTRIRKVEFADARDLKQWMWKGIDGIPETTWPGVYNRSRLPGRNDYLELPDWNVYVEGGWAYELTVPPGERFNQVEIRGAAYGTLVHSPDGSEFAPLASRAQGALRSVHSFQARTGGRLRFANDAQETPIQEIWAYDLAPGDEPDGTRKLTYSVRASVSPEYAALQSLNDFIAGRYPAAERSTVVALPSGPGSSRVPLGAGRATAGTAAVREQDALPIVHVLVPSGFGEAFPARPVTRAWNYGWENAYDGLDGIAIDLPALAAVRGSANAQVAMNLRIKDPIWPGRDMLDVSFSVMPGMPHTLWLDLRDRILTQDSLYLSLASADPGFRAGSLDGMNIRLVFKDREAASAEHVADRFNQVKDNWGFLVEEHTASKRASLYRRLFADVSDLLRIDPDHVEGRRYWADISYEAMGFPPMAQTPVPEGVPAWAFRQLEDLKLVRHFVEWWIDERQVEFGDFGGGLSDDTDMTQQWPGLALMGVMPDKINASLRAVSEAVYANGMIVNGLGTITTDELHAYEEGLNSDAQRLYLNWGEPRAVERLMATTRALAEVIIENPAGHVHFASNWYGGRKVFREGPWEWQKPYSFAVMHTPTLLGVYNGNPLARGLVTGVMDGWLAHARQDAQGRWSVANEVNWRTDEERRGDGGGMWLPWQTAWAAWRLTGDEKYLLPVLMRTELRGPGSLEDINENAIRLLAREADWGGSLVAAADGGSEFAMFTAWDVTGDRGWLERLHEDAIELKSQRMYMHTEGHWWSDRVEMSSETLQRERLGGIALWRNQHYPGNTVSWRFFEPDAAERVALLVRGATPERFTVVAWNTTDRPQRADMTTWNVVAGTWRMVGPDGKSADLALERSASLPMTFAPGVESVYTFSLVEPGTPTEQRADLGIGPDDVVTSDTAIAVMVHSLGARRAEGGIATLEDATGRVLASTPVPALEAPLDLLPRRTQVLLPRPAEAPIGLRVRVSLPEGVPELTRLNNVVTLPAD